MKRATLENAINRLARLLRDNESSESKYQEFFEKNLVVFEVLGYALARPKVRLPLPENERLEPDFIVQRADDGLFEIFELKTPQEKLIHSKLHREKFTAKVDEYISQVNNYSAYFDDNKNRELIQELHSLDIQKHPDMIVVVGTDEGVDKKLLHLLTRDRAHGLKIFTYDDILKALRFHHASLFGHSENLAGISWHGIVTVYETDIQTRQYVFDAGDSLSRNRVSVYIDKRKHLRFEIIDRDGNAYSISARSGQNTFDFGKRSYICCEFGNSDVFSIMQILVDNRIIATQEFANSISISTGLDFGKRTIGADINGQNHATFDMAGLAIYNITLPLKQRQALSDSIFEEFFVPHSLEELAAMSTTSRVVIPNTSKYLIIGN